MSWPIKKLSELLETCDAGTWGKPAPKGKGLLVLRSTNITNGGSLDFTDVAELDIQDKVENLKLLSGDILLEKSGGGPDQPVGRVVYFMTPSSRVYTFANFIQRLRANSKFIDSHFLFYRLFFLHKIGFTKKLQSQTTGIRNLKMSLYLKTEIPIPPLAIQKQIVERLDKISEVQKLNDGLIQKTDELFQSLLHKELNPTQQHTNKLENVGMSSNQKWEVKKLGEVCEINPSKVEINKLPESTVVSFLAMADVSEDAEITNKQERKLSEVKNGFTFFENEDVLVAKITPCFENGKGAFVENMVNGIGFGSTEFHVLRANQELLLNKLLYYLVSDKRFRKIGARFLTGSAGQQRVPTHYLENFKIPLPPLKTQKQIVAKLSAVQEYKKKLIEQKIKLKELFDSTLHKSMSNK